MILSRFDVVVKWGNLIDVPPTPYLYKLGVTNKKNGFLLCTPPIVIHIPTATLMMTTRKTWGYSPNLYLTVPPFIDQALSSSSSLLTLKYYRHLKNEGCRSLQLDGAS